MTTSRSSGDIAVDLTELSIPRISKLSRVESNDPLIMASNGSLISTGTRSSSVQTSDSQGMISSDKSELIQHVLIPGSADSEVSEEQKKEKIAGLKKKEKELQDALTQKLEELKKLCMKEAVGISGFRFGSGSGRAALTSAVDLQELTGRLPKEYPLATGEKAPPVRRRVGTAFRLDDPSLSDEVCKSIVFAAFLFVMKLVRMLLHVRNGHFNPT